MIFMHCQCYNYRNISLYMKTRNIIGSSKGYVERVMDSDSSVTPEDVQKYFLSTLKFMALYMEASFCSSCRISGSANEGPHSLSAHP